MSRSTYIWIVQETTGTVVATFTVKHELATWLDLFSHKRHLLAVTRHSDGRPGVPPVALNPKTLELAI